ncbi:MAG: signal peptide peptidase SppA [Candidatus Acidiferrales bacterium]
MTWGKRRALVILALLGVMVLIIWAASANRISPKSVLVLELNGDIQEQHSNELLSVLNGNYVPVQHEIVDSIATAKNDPRITGLVVRIGPLETGWAKLEEIHARMISFRESRKPSLCFLGYDGIGNPEYYLASACDQIWLVPTAPVQISGLMAESLFFKGALDKLKIVPNMYHIGDYKAASNQYTEKKFTPAHREETESLVRGIYDQYVTEVSQARKMERVQFDSLVKQGPFLATEALSNKLVDKLAYWDDVQKFFDQKNGDWRPVDLAEYHREIKNDGSEDVAVVYATGEIASGDSGSSYFSGPIMGGDSVASDLRRARNDSSIKAIILRVDSGGGSALASEVIRHELLLAKKQKPVVISMSDVAASGGYWIAMSANKIVAEPDTITASIGVVLGKMNISGLYQLLGLSTDYVSTSENATLFSDQQDFTPAQRQAILKGMQQTYSDFTKGVADGRNMSVEAVDKIGQGRVWTGAQGKNLGLVDELGGLDRAIEISRQLAHIPSAARVRLIRFPEERTFLELLFSKEHPQLDRGSNILEQLHQLNRISEPVRARIPFDLHIR